MRMKLSELLCGRGLVFLLGLDLILDAYGSWLGEDGYFFVFKLSGDILERTHE